MTLDVARRIVVFVLVAVGLMMGPALFAQVVDVAEPVVAQPAESLWALGIWAFVSSTAMEWLKQNPRFTLISEATTKKAQMAMGAVMAAAATLGVHYTFDQTAGTLVVTGLTLSAMGAMVSEIVKTWFLQELLYRVAVKKTR